MGLKLSSLSCLRPQASEAGGNEEDTSAKAGFGEEENEDDSPNDLVALPAPHSAVRDPVLPVRSASRLRRSPAFVVANEDLIWLTNEEYEPLVLMNRQRERSSLTLREMEIEAAALAENLAELRRRERMERLDSLHQQEEARRERLERARRFNSLRHQEIAEESCFNGRRRLRTPPPIPFGNSFGRGGGAPRFPGRLPPSCPEIPPIQPGHDWSSWLAGGSFHRSSPRVSQQVSAFPTLRRRPSPEREQGRAAGACCRSTCPRPPLWCPHRDYRD